MKYLLVNDQATLTSMGAVDQTFLFPQNAVLGIESINSNLLQQVFEAALAGKNNNESYYYIKVVTI